MTSVFSNKGVIYVEMFQGLTAWGGLPGAGEEAIIACPWVVQAASGPGLTASAREMYCGLVGPEAYDHRNDSQFREDVMDSSTAHGGPPL